MLKYRATDALETLSPEQLQRLYFIVEIINSHPDSIRDVDIPPDDREYHLLNAFRQFFKGLTHHLRRW